MKKQQTREYREQTRGYQWREGIGEEQFGVGEKGAIMGLSEIMCVKLENCKVL